MRFLNNKYYHYVLALATFMLYSESLYARAGGGGGSGRGGLFSLFLKIILLPAFLIYYYIRNKKIKDKKLESTQIIEQAAAEDPFWNEAKMEQLTKDMFNSMQTAWMERDLSSVKHQISADLYHDYSIKLAVMQSNKEKNILEDINIKEVSIISSEDYKDNTKDAFVAFITGNILDYTINETTGKVIKNKKKDAETFSDTYHFIRQGNKWILNNINNKVSLSDIDDSKNIKE